MKLYFVRHGETNNNLQKRVVSFNDQLTDNGRLQAQQLAKRIAEEPIDLIITSPHKRTKETAEIVAKKININIQEISLLGEKKWPSVIEGKLLKDPEVEKVFDLMREKNNVDPNWHYSDEENFLDIKKRAQLFIEYVSKLTYANILAVSHEYFIKMIIATMMHGDRLSYEIFRDFFHFTSLDNTSLTLCEKERDVWKLITLNDRGLTIVDRGLTSIV
jgi:broad specificity phosphatase PhoE